MVELRFLPTPSPPRADPVVEEVEEGKEERSKKRDEGTALVVALRVLSSRGECFAEEGDACVLLLHSGGGDECAVTGGWVAGWELEEEEKEEAGVRP